jgi:diphthine-ammonia ligase
MRVIGLVSGGKDSCYNLMKCVQYGHEIVALANLRPPVLERMAKDRNRFFFFFRSISGFSDRIATHPTEHELDSFMFQTVGHTAIDAYAEALGLPLYRGSISGQPKKQSLEYEKTVGDEVESLYELIEMIKVLFILDFFLSSFFIDF